jgi:FKBP-type peptidyl-prolyl cis-trans isomerase FkpA
MKKIIILICTCLIAIHASAQVGKKKKVKQVKKQVGTEVAKVKYKKLPEGLIKLPNGIAYKIITKGTGQNKPKIGDNITMHIRAYVSDSMLFDSYKLNNNEAVPAKISEPQFNGDIMGALVNLVAGDSAIMYVHPDSIFRNGMTPPFAKPGDYVFYQIKMETVKDGATFEKEQKELAKLATAADDVKIQAYIKANNLKDVKKTESGLYYQIVSAGTGDLAPIGKEVTMNYTGYLTDGKEFDSNVKPEFQHVSPFKFTLGKGMVIRGWDEGVALLNKGAKAKLIIPSPLAYGPQARPGLPANSILIFDVELVDF